MKLEDFKIGLKYERYNPLNNKWSSHIIGDEKFLKHIKYIFTIKPETFRNYER